MASFHHAFEFQDSVLLQQPNDAPIVRVSGLDRDPAGRILVGDAPEGNVKLFDRDGSLIKVIGRKGRGPGEFSAPRYPRFGPDGRIYVADAQDPRIQVFDSAGNYLAGIRVEAGVLMGFHPLAPDRFLILGEREGKDRVLLELDGEGAIQREYLAIGNVLPTGQQDFPLWRNVRSFFVTVMNDTAFVSSTISDTLWHVHLPSGAEGRTHLVFPGYTPPTRPDRMPEGIPGLLEWNRSFHAGSTLSSDAGHLYLPYVRGVLNYGDPMLLLTRTPTGWIVMEDAPPVIGAGGGAAIGLLTPESEEVRLGIYRPRVSR